MAMQYDRSQLEKSGYIILRDFFPREIIDSLKESAQRTFDIQFKHFKYSNENSFKENMIKLFNEHNEVFINCGKTIQQGNILLYKLPLEEKLLEAIKSLGIKLPNLCTRPVLYFNHPRLAKEEVYYKTPPHQDWSSMEASMNSLVVWVPLVDVNKQNGSIIIYPGSHKAGVLPFASAGGFAQVDTRPFKDAALQPELKVGDIAIFSTLLVHESGAILDDSIRWSCHYRFTDLLAPDFIQRGFPNPYIYKPMIKQ